MYTKISHTKRKLRSLAWKIFNAIENNNNATFEKNGEKFFLSNLFKFWHQSKCQNPIIFDVGANIGHYTELLLQFSQSYHLNPTFHLFEPTQKCYQILKNKFRANDNMIINQAGVSNQNKKTFIYYDKPTSGLASLYQRNLSHYHIEMNQKEEITLIRLDSYIEQYQIPHIHFMKMDIEGHEYYALEGLKDYCHPEFIDFIQFEYGGANLDAHILLFDLYHFFESKQFKIAKILKKGLEIRPYSPWMENFQYANYVALSPLVIEQAQKSKT